MLINSPLVVVSILAEVVEDGGVEDFSPIVDESTTECSSTEVVTIVL